jgi:hypothetical protein
VPIGANQNNELVQLQSEITNEITRDAPHIATMVFGDNADHPDMAQVGNQQLDDLYRQKYQSEDRTWLQAEARRDPEQFMKVAQRIGVAIPPPQPPPAPAPMRMPVPSVAPVPAALPPPVPVAAPQVLPPAPPQPLSPAPAALSMPPGLGPPPSPPPVLLGPNGQPLPAMASGGVA